MLLKFFLGAMLIGVVVGLGIAVVKTVIYAFFAAIFKGIPYLLQEMFGGREDEATKLEVKETKEVEAPKPPISDPLLSLEPDKEKFVSKWKKNNEGRTFKNFEKWSEA